MRLRLATIRPLRAAPNKALPTTDAGLRHTNKWWCIALGASATIEIPILSAGHQNCPDRLHDSILPAHVTTCHTDQPIPFLPPPEFVPHAFESLAELSSAPGAAGLMRSRITITRDEQKWSCEQPAQTIIKSLATDKLNITPSRQ